MKTTNKQNKQQNKTKQYKTKLNNKNNKPPQKQNKQTKKPTTNTTHTQKHQQTHKNTQSLSAASVRMNYRLSNRLYVYLMHQMILLFIYFTTYLAHYTIKEAVSSLSKWRFPSKIIGIVCSLYVDDFQICYRLSNMNVSCNLFLKINFNNGQLATFLDYPR